MLAALLLSAAPLGAAADMCALCVSFLDTTTKENLASVRNGLNGDCAACASLSSGLEETSCALLCDHAGADTFTSLIDVSDYIGSKDMCQAHQICEQAQPTGAVALLEVAAQQSNSTKKPGNVTINGDFTVTGSLKTKSIRSSALTVNGSITVTHAVRTEYLKADNTKASVVETSTLSSPTGSIMLSGTLNMANQGAMFAESLHTNNLIQLGVKQWSLVHHDDFESGTSDWMAGSGSFVEVSSSGADSFLGGHCKTAGGEISKRYADLPEHSFLRVQARYHFIDSWEGETAFLKLDDKVAWADSADARGSKGLNIVGGDHPEHKYGVPIDVVVPHTSNSVLLALGSNLDEHACDESFGVDDVMISVR